MRLPHLNAAQSAAHPDRAVVMGNLPRRDFDTFQAAQVAVGDTWIQIQVRKLQLVAQDQADTPIAGPGEGSGVRTLPTALYLLLQPHRPDPRLP